MKVQISVSDDLVKKIDVYASMMGVSRSALCAVFIGQGVMGFNKAYELVDNMSEALLKGEMANEKKQ